MNFQKLNQVDCEQKGFLSAPTNIEILSNWKIYVVVAVTCVFIMIFGASIMGGKDGLKMQAIAMGGLVLMLLIVCVMLKDAASKKWMFILTLFIAGSYCLLYIGAVNNFPEFIRRIKGENFTTLWWIYTAVVLLSTLAIQYYCILILSKKSMDELKNKYYSDSDLMLISDYSRYRLTGYYLIKAKLDGIIRWTHFSPSPNIESLVQVYLDETITEESLKDYCDKNPEVRPIVEYMQRQKEFGEEFITVEKVINNSSAQPEIQSPGGIAVAQTVFKAERCKNILICIAFCLIYYVGFTKLMMGMHNEKTVEFLGVFGFGVSALMVLIFIGLGKTNMQNLLNIHIRDQLIYMKKHRMNDFDQMLQSALVDGNYMTQEQKEELLKCYATSCAHWSYWSRSTNDSNRYANTLLNSIDDAEKRDAAEAELEAERRRRASRIYGCGYGCSSCGGCGGGGCGGCGD